MLGKYTTRDPSGYPDGPNNYLYVNNNPINSIDPLGLEEVFVGWAYVFVNTKQSQIYVGSTSAEISRFSPRSKFKPYHKSKLIKHKDTHGVFRPVYANNIKTFADAEKAVKAVEQEVLDSYRNSVKKERFNHYKIQNVLEPKDEIKEKFGTTIDKVKKAHSPSIRSKDTIFFYAGRGPSVDADVLKAYRDKVGNIQPKLQAERQKSIAKRLGKGGAGLLALWTLKQSLESMQNTSEVQLQAQLKDVLDDNIPELLVAKELPQLPCDFT